MQSQPVSVKAAKSVVSMTVAEVIVPSWPMFFAMTKQLTVVAEPSMTRIATSFSARKPRKTAAGRKRAARPISLINEAVTAGAMRPDTFLISKVAPIAIRPSGVAMPLILETVFSRMGGIGRRKSDQRMPAAIPKIIGFVIIPLKVFFHIGRPAFFCFGPEKDKTVTAIIL